MPTGLHIKYIEYRRDYWNMADANLHVELVMAGAYLYILNIEGVIGTWNMVVA